MFYVYFGLVKRLLAPGNRLDCKPRTAFFTPPNPYYNKRNNNCQENYGDNYKQDWVYKNNSLDRLGFPARVHCPGHSIDTHTW